MNNANNAGGTVLVAGATGVIGWRAVRELVGAGHRVSAVARSPQKGRRLAQLGATPIDLDLFDPAAVEQAVAGHQVVINLATHIPPVSRGALPGAWAENDRIRTEVSANLAKAVIATDAQRYLQESITFIYEDGGDRWLDEGAPVDLPRYLRSVQAAEAAAEAVTAAGKVGIALRFAQFHGPDASHTLTALQLGRRGLAPVVGSREGYVSIIHLDDAATAVVAALGLDAGVVNVADDEPLRRADNAAAIAAAIGKPALRWVGAAGKAGGRRMKPLMRSHRVANGRLRSTGWAPRYASAREAWAAIVADVDGRSG